MRNLPLCSGLLLTGCVCVFEDAVLSERVEWPCLSCTARSLHSMLVCRGHHISPPFLQHAPITQSTLHHPHPGSASTAVGDVSVCLLPSALLLHRGNYSSRCAGLVSKCTVALEVTGQRRPASWLTWYAEVHEVAVPCTRGVDCWCCCFSSSLLVAMLVVDMHPAG